MKRTIPILITLFVLINTVKVSAQISFSDLVRSSTADAGKIINAYTEPFYRGLGTGMNSNWNNTAKTKSTLHFDVRIGGTGAVIPTSDKTFDVTKIGLSNNVRPADPSKKFAPTIGGGKNIQGPLMDVYDNNSTRVDQFSLPSGELSVIPSPQIQITIGLPQNTDITIRSIPSVKFGNNAGSISMIGFGLKHNILEDFAGSMADRLVPFDLAIALGYSRLNTSIGIDVKPDNGAQPENNQQSTDFSNQRFETHFNSFIMQAIISKKLLFFTPFLAVGYNKANANAAVLGNYPVTSGVSATFQPTYTTLTNPVTIKEKTLSGMRADMGFQLNLAIFRIYASYSLAKYKSYSGGIGFGF